MPSRRLFADAGTHAVDGSLPLSEFRAQAEPPRAKPRGPARIRPAARDALSLDELNRIFAAARTLTGNVAGVDRAHWWRAFLLVILETNIYHHRLLRLRPRDVDFERSLVKIGLFEFRLSSRTTEALRAVIGNDPEFLFPLKSSIRDKYSWFNRQTKELQRRAGIRAVHGPLLQRLRSTLNADLPGLEDVNLDAPLELPPATSCHPYNTTGIYSIAIAPAFAHRSLRTFFESQYVPRRLQNPETARIFRLTINRLCEFAACEVTLDQLSDDFVERFIFWLEKRGHAPHTRKKEQGEILALWRYAWKKRQIDELPRDVDAVAVPKIEPEAWSIEEMGRLLNAATAETGNVGEIPAAAFWTALLYFLYDTGLRIDAALSVKSADLDLNGRWVKARFETQKQFADQSLRVSQEGAALLRAISPAERRVQLFPWPYTISTARDHLRRILRRAGLPCGRRDLFHKIRRTNGTYVCDASDEFAAMRQLGHSSIEMTRRYIDRRKLSAPTPIDSMRRPNFAAAPTPKLTPDQNAREAG